MYVLWSISIIIKGYVYNINASINVISKKYERGKNNNVV